MNRSNLQKTIGTGIATLIISLNATQAFSSGSAPVQRELIKTISVVNEVKSLPVTTNQAIVIRSSQPYKYMLVAYDLYSDDGVFQMRAFPRGSSEAIAIGDVFSRAQDDGVEEVNANVTRTLQLWRVYDDGDVSEETHCSITIKIPSNSESTGSMDLVLEGHAPQAACSVQ